MITKVEIENFQSHKKTVVEFVPGTNVIIGESDAGKSALFRAINWVCSNRPLGDSFRSEWGGDTKVTLYTIEGDVIERVRASSRNEYIVNGKALTAFGAEVPDDVTNILQIDSANIQAQMDPPFLLSATPGEAARMLNRAASIDEIDYTVSGLKKSYSKIDGDIKHSQKQLAEHNKQMERYADIPVIEERLEKAEQLNRDFTKKRKSHSALVLLASRAANIEEKLGETKQLPDLIRRWEQLEKQHQIYQEKTLHHKKFSAAVERARELEEAITASENLEEAVSLLEQLERSFFTWKERNHSLSQLQQFTLQGKRLFASLDMLKKTIAQLEKEYRRLAPEICPLCGNRMRETV